MRQPEPDGSHENTAADQHVGGRQTRSGLDRQVKSLSLPKALAFIVAAAAVVGLAAPAMAHVPSKPAPIGGAETYVAQLMANHRTVVRAEEGARMTSQAAAWFNHQRSIESQRLTAQAANYLRGEALEAIKSVLDAARTAAESAPAGVAPSVAALQAAIDTADNATPAGTADEILAALNGVAAAQGGLEAAIATYDAEQAAKVAPRSTRGPKSTTSGTSGGWDKARIDAVAAQYGITINYVTTTSCGYTAAPRYVTGCSDGSAVELSVGSGLAASDTWFVEQVLRHELSHVSIYRVCRTTYPAIAGSRGENVTDAWANQYGGATSTAAGGYGYNSTDAAAATAIHNGTCA